VSWAEGAGGRAEDGDAGGMAAEEAEPVHGHVAEALVRHGERAPSVAADPSVELAQLHVSVVCARVE
jgi:hypothetical protein